MPGSRSVSHAPETWALADCRIEVEGGAVEIDEVVWDARRDRETYLHRQRVAGTHGPDAPAVHGDRSMQIRGIMSQGLNRVMLLGNLGADPELRYTAANQPVLKLRLATTESYLDKDKVRRERTDWHDVVVWGPRGAALAKILARGSSVFVEGSLRTSSYDDRDGNKRYKTEVIARDLLLTGRRHHEGNEEGDEALAGRGDGASEDPSAASDAPANAASTQARGGEPPGREAPPPRGASSPGGSPTSDRRGGRRGTEAAQRVRPAHVTGHAGAHSADAYSGNFGGGGAGADTDDDIPF
jgi:single-strand DNA-binding protein